MAEREVRIRRYAEPEDGKLFRFVVSRANMEMLAVANHKAYTNPFVISVWLTLSCLFIEYMKWWPSLYPGNMGYFIPIPAFASMAVPLMFFIDWLHRPYFKKVTMDVLRGPDMQNPQAYYTRHSASGIWIIEYGDTFCGLIALDSRPTDLPKAVGEGKAEIPDNMAYIRHFYVDEAYRNSLIQDDILRHAVGHAFNEDETLQNIIAQDSSLASYLRESFHRARFRLGSEMETVGVLRWKVNIRILERPQWRTTSS